MQGAADNVTILVVQSVLRGLRRLHCVVSDPMFILFYLYCHWLLCRRTARWMPAAGCRLSCSWSRGHGSSASWQKNPPSGAHCHHQRAMVRARPQGGAAALLAWLKLRVPRAQGIPHGDLKAANVLYVDGVFCLTDMPALNWSATPVLTKDPVRTHEHAAAIPPLSITPSPSILTMKSSLLGTVAEA